MDEAILAGILEAQGFIARNLQDLSGHLFSQLGWNQRVGDWGAEVHSLAAYVGRSRFVLPFSLEELITDVGSVVWKRVLLDKVHWFIDQVLSEIPDERGGQGADSGPSSSDRLTAPYVLQNADFNYMSSSRKWAVCGWRQVVYVTVTASLTVDEARRCMEELWGAFLALKKRYGKVYTVLDLNRMELNTEEFRHYMKKHWLHVLDREDLAIIFIEKSAMKKAIWSSIALLLGKAGRVKLFTVSEMAFDWVQSQISADDRMKAGKQSQGSMTGLPDRLTLEWLQDRAQQNLIGANNRWAITAWNNVVYLKIRENWTPEEGDQYVDHLAAIPGMLGEAWGRVFFIFDISNMAFKPEDLQLYVRAKWLEALDHEEMSVCLVEAKRVRRLLLHSVYNLLGKRSRVKIMASPDEALQWVQRELAAAAAAQGGSEETK